MPPRRREQRASAPRLEDLTDEELVHVRFFGDCDRYVALPGDREHATEILRARGHYRWDAARGQWVSPKESA
jgi:hypothetical protein